jgi:YHS domain-containing protein
MAVVGAIVITLALSADLTLAEDQKKADQPRSDAYMLDYCLVSGAKLGSMGQPAKIDHNGREIKFCCAGCIDEFKANADKYLGKLDSAIVEQQLAYYPLNACVVSGEKFGGEMGEPMNQVYHNRLVRFCCQMCAPAFTKNPESYLSRLDSAVVANQIAAYPLNTCVISGQKLGSMGPPVDYVYGNRFVRFCFWGCVDAFNENPTEGLAKIDAAMKAEKIAEKETEEKPKKTD